MAISSWMIRNRSMRSRGRPPPEDFYKLDLTKSIYENSYEIYAGLSSRMISDNKRLSLLNGFVKLLEHAKNENLGFSTEDFLYCISASLVHSLTQIRAGALRAIRHLLKTSKDIQSFNGLQLSHLVCRSLDILLKNEEERVQALKLIRKMLVLAPDIISPVLVRCLVALGESGAEDGDRMLRACLACLCEFGVLNPTLLIICGGVSAITRNVLECHSPRIAESLCGVLLHLLEWPYTRNIAGVRLDCLAAPYCDFTYRLGIMDKNKDARDLRFTCSRLALLSVLRSWAGTIEFCDPNKPSGLKAIVDVLYLNQLEVRKAILDLLYELLGLPQPVWTDEYSVALSVVDPSDFQDSWRLAEGFIAMEGRSILPSLASRTPNICEIHLSVLLYCFIETGLLDALVEVIVSSDTFISVRSTVLLGKLLQLMHTLLPADICSMSPALPTLITYATQGNHQARAAVSALQSLHQLLKNRPAACSLFLDNIIQSGSIINTKIFKREIVIQDNVSTISKNGTIERRRHDSVGSTSSASGTGVELSVRDEQQQQQQTNFMTNKRSSIKRNKFLQFLDGIRETERLIRDSNVLLNKDGNSWDWDIVIAIFRSDSIGKLDDTQCRFIRRLVHYFKPSSNRFSHQDLAHGRHIPAFVTAGLELIDWLLQSQELECIRLLTDLFTDINIQLFSISTSRSAHDCLFSPQHMSSTMCQQYFLFIGRMCRSDKGLGILNNTDVFKQMLSLVSTTNHVCYIKLIVSGLDYTLDAIPRRILEKSLTSSPQRLGRLYATQFMLVLLRAKLPNFEVWGLPMIIKQTNDADRSVVLSALEILDEACHDRAYLEELVSIWPNLDQQGDAGKLVMTRFYSIPRGLNHTKAIIKTEIEYWISYYNKRYVLLIEADTHASLTLHTKNEDGTYCRRSCSSRPVIVPPNILPHLYGQLVQTSQGMANLQKYGDLQKLIEILSNAKSSNENESLLLKSAMWALGHVSTSTEGVEFLNDPSIRIYEKIIHLAKFSEVYSIRSTALNVLGLIGSTNTGANVLYKLDWICVRHDRNTYWPVCEPEDWLSKHLSPVRHQIGDMAPYNYTGIDENINGFSTNSDGSNSFYFDENGESGKESREDSFDQITLQSVTQANITARSRTLPESSVTRPTKHTRSLSESKTSDGISLITTNNQHRTRFNSGTDSNTSGVSSCDSVYGRYIFGDLHPTLSPIQSSSNLLDVKKSSGTGSLTGTSGKSTVDTNDRYRRISLGAQRESVMTPQDLQGYTLLRSLRRHCRPMLSESAADELAEIIDSNNINDTMQITSISLRGQRNSIKNDQQRKLKVRSLDRHYTLPFSSSGIEEFRSSISGSTSSKLIISTVTRGPCYSGICLPKNIYDLFPKRNNHGTYVSHYIQELDTIDNVQTINPAKPTVGTSTQPTTSVSISMLKQQFFNDSIVEGDESSISSLSDISINSKRTKWAGKHNRQNCLHCCRSKINRLHPRTDSDINILRRKSQSQYSTSSIQLTDLSFNSPESVFSDESMPDRITSNILRHVQRMANPVWFKQSKSSLLELKQKHPSSFQDICLYSEVCKSLGRNTYRQNARRFLQELFLDLNFDSFFNESNEIINRHNDLNEINKDNAVNIIYRPEYDENMFIIKSSMEVSRELKPNIFKSKELATAPGSSGIIPVSAGISTSIVMKHNLKSPQLESVFETSFENLHDFKFRQFNNNNNNINNAKDNSEQSSLSNQIRSRTNRLELDLSCTKNKFPITNRSLKSYFTPIAPTITTNSNYSKNDQFLSSSVTTPTSLFCEKRLLKTSKSEATLNNDINNINNTNNSSYFNNNNDDSSNRNNFDDF